MLPEDSIDFMQCDPALLSDGPPVSWTPSETFLHREDTEALPMLDSGAAPDGLYRLAASGLVFRVRVWGLENQGPPLVLLHGFPSSSIMWQHLGVSAAAEGYRVVAIDQRGTSPGARPAELEAYAMPNFLGDVMAIADVLGFERFHLGGHDLGCVVSWMMASQHPERLESLSCLSVAHPATLRSTLVDDPPPYIQTFTLPSPAPEMILTSSDAGLLRTQYAFMNEAECREYNRIFMEPDALRSTLDFYRAIALSYEAFGENINDPITTPTLFMYGTGEQWVNAERLAAQDELVTSEVYEVVELDGAGDTGHFIVESNRAETTERILEHLRATQ